MMYITNHKYCCNFYTMEFYSFYFPGFNTINGRYYFLFTFVLPSLRSGKQCADLIVALLLCCLTLCGAYRER